MSEETQFPVQKLGEVVEVLDHLRIPVNSEARAKRKGDVPYYGANGLQGWIDKPIFNEPLILMAEDGGNFDDFSTRPIAYRIDGPAWVNNHAHIIKAANPKLHSFIYWSVAYKDIRKYVAGGTRQKLNQSALKEIEIPCPPENEGEVAGKVLDTLDTQIQKTEALIAKLGKVKEALLHDLLTRGIDENGQLRPRPDQAPELYKESPLGLIPREWQVGLIGSFGQLISGQHIPGELSNRDGRGIPYFTGPADFLSGRTVVTNHTESPQVVCSKGDLLITVKGSGCGKIAIASIDACISRQLMAFKFPENQKDFWKSFFTHNENNIKVIAEGGAIPGISRHQLLSMLAACPREDDEFSRISNIIKNNEERISSESRRLKKIMQEKTGLMDDLLTGRVRVTPLLEKDQAQATTPA